MTHGKITFEEFVAMIQDERRTWLASPAHRLSCAAYNEGQKCCLEILMDRDDQETIHALALQSIEKQLDDELVLKWTPEDVS